MPFKRQFYDPFIQGSEQAPWPDPADLTAEAQDAGAQIRALNVEQTGVYLLTDDVAAWLRQQAEQAAREQRSGPWQEALEAAADALEQTTQP